MGIVKCFKYAQKYISFLYFCRNICFDALQYIDTVFNHFQVFLEETTQRLLGHSDQDSNSWFCGKNHLSYISNSLV